MLTLAPLLMSAVNTSGDAPLNAATCIGAHPSYIKKIDYTWSLITIFIH